MTTLLPLAADLQLGTLAEWVAALGTVGAFWATYRLLRKELAARREQEEDRRREQARHVSVWLEAEVKELAKRWKYVIVLRNGSEEPVYDVKVTLVAKDSPFASDPEAVRNEDGTLKEAGPITVSEEILPPGVPVKHPIPAGLLPSVFAPAGLSFTDSQGRRWKRYPKGRLEELERPRPRSYKDYMNAWIAGELDRLDY